MYEIEMPDEVIARAVLERVPLSTVSCDFSIGLYASGGEGEIISQGWDAKQSWQNQWVSFSAAGFANEWGRDRLQSGDRVLARFHAQRLSGDPPQGFDAQARFRFLMPDGALQTFDLRVPCYP